MQNRVDYFEPWIISDTSIVSEEVWDVAPDPFTGDPGVRTEIIDCYGAMGVSIDFMRRIVACVNACKGIPTEALEQGVIKDMQESLEFYADGRNWNSVDTGIGEFPGEAVDNGSSARSALYKLKAV